MEEMILPGRAARFKEVISKRQGNLTVVLENVHDPHNIGAVLRSCDSVGIKEIFVIYSDPYLFRENLYLSPNTASGANRWIDVHFYTDIDLAMTHIQRNYDTILTTHLAEDSKDLYDLDLTQSVALMFGNERDGLSKEALAYSNGNFIIPQVGMVQSLNISVACAVTLYEALRQRQKANMYLDNTTETETEKTALFAAYHERQVAKDKRKTTRRISK